MKEKYDKWEKLWEMIRREEKIWKRLEMIKEKDDKKKERKEDEREIW